MTLSPLHLFVNWPGVTIYMYTAMQQYSGFSAEDFVAGFLLLFIYAMINMNIVSWGTREVANVDDVEVDIANRVKQPNIWTSFIHEVAYEWQVLCVG